MKRYFFYASVCLVFFFFLATAAPIALAQRADQPPAPETPFATPGNGSVDFYKVLAAPGQLDATQLGVTLWHDYGAFALYRVASDVLDRLPADARAEITVLTDADQLLMKAYC